jgi:hypothetical protein
MERISVDYYYDYYYYCAIIERPLDKKVLLLPVDVWNAMKISWFGELSIFSITSVFIMNSEISKFSIYTHKQKQISHTLTKREKR